MLTRGSGRGGGGTEIPKKGWASIVNGPLADANIKKINRLAKQQKNKINIPELMFDIIKPNI